MKKRLHVAVPAFFLVLMIVSCSKTSNTKDLSVWVGDYVYKEEPIEATQGIFKNMVWQLSIQLQNDSCKGILEILGDRTYTKALTTITGDSNYIDVVFNKLLNGADENLIDGEILFSMARDHGKLITTWDLLEPRLEEFPPGDCICFISKKKFIPKKKRKR